MAVWAPAAIADLQDAWLYISTDNEDAADRLVERLRSAAERLDRHPLIGRPGQMPGSREFSVSDTRYFLVYFIGKGEIEIARVVHSARRWPPKG